MRILVVHNRKRDRTAGTEEVLRGLAEREGRTDVQVRGAACDLVTADEVRRADLIVLTREADIERILDRQPDAAARCAVADGDAALGEIWRRIQPASQDVYVEAVERRFRELRKRPLNLPPADWEVIDGWWRQGIPLWIVLESLEDAFDWKRPAGDARRVRGLRYFTHDVNERFEAYRRSRVVSTAQPERSSPTAAAASRLAAAAARARAEGWTVAAGLFDEAVAAVAAIIETENPVTLIQTLDGLEERLVGRLGTSMGEERLETMMRDATRRLEDHRDRMTDAAFDSTVRRAVDRMIRDHFGVPDLTAR